jgi:hypothetical protein
LTRVTYQDGTYREYLYEIATFLYALTGIVDENGDRYATFGYASGTYNFSDGKVIATQHAQTTNGVPQEKFTIVYNSATRENALKPLQAVGDIGSCDYRKCRLTWLSDLTIGTTGEESTRSWYRQHVTDTADARTSAE